MAEKKELLALTGLRFVAALYVFLFHMHSSWPVTSHELISSVLKQGAIGMSIFFVLSGFVLTYQYQDGSKGPRDYFVSRLARIYPVYLVAALITLPWFGVSLGETWWRGFAQAALLIFANVFLLQAWFPQFFSLWNGGGSWSISVEAFCYLALPLILPKLVSLTWNQQKAVAATCIVLAALPGLVLKFFDTPTPGAFYSVPIFRLPEFVLGCFVCIAWSKGHLGPQRSITQLAIALAFLAYLSLAGSRFPMFVGHNWIAIPTIAITILFLAHSRGIIASVLATRVFVWLGQVSYSFYSFQVFLLLLLDSHRDTLVRHVPVFEDNLILLVVSFVALLGMSAVGYYVIEEPCRKWIKNRLTQAS
jgi:peptidoglycan/LPS O-acetylase OafA/YrhL